MARKKPEKKKGDATPQTSPAIGKTLVRMIREAKGTGGWMLLALLTVTVSCIFQVLFASNLSKATQFISDGQLDAFYQAGIMIAVVMLVKVVAEALNSYCRGRYGQQVLRMLRHKTALAVSNATMGWLDTQHTGDLNSRMSEDLRQVSDMVGTLLNWLPSNILMFVGAVIYLSSINWVLTLTAFLFTPVAMVLSIYISKPAQKYQTMGRDADGKASSTAQEALSGLTVTKSFGLERLMLRKYDESQDKSFRANMKGEKFFLAVAPLRIFSSFAPMLVTASIGGGMVASGRMGIGDFMAFVVLLDYIVMPLNNMEWILRQIRMGCVSAHRIFTLWDAPMERNTGKVFSEEGEALRFENVHFGYGETELLKGFTLSIKKGEMVALAGPSGCGKSTALKLASAFYPVTEGEIKLWEQNMDQWSIDGLRGQMAVVSQDTYLFPETLRYNITGGEEVPQARIEAACRAAGIWPFIESLPDRLENLVGERGVKLSGGQRQRVAIARALLKDAPILLLDEATSSLDTITEKEVQHALEDLMQHRTCLVVAHRLSTIRNASRIAVMDEGRVVEEGTHEQLLAANGLYARLYSAQQEQYGEEVGA